MGIRKYKPTSPGLRGMTVSTFEEITKLQEDYTNLLKAVVDLLDGAQYLWKGDTHE